MASIDEVINRSREPGEFTERRQFTIARGRAIQKLRKFALVDPHYYILELIQSAVANGATYIDIQCDSSSTALSYIGGSFPESALAQLFDFLFAADDDVEHGPLRQLALGVNALMIFEPDEIVIETGDGTLLGTTRAVIRGDSDIVEIGRPEEALDGTYLRAVGMSRRESRRRSQLKQLDGHPREYHAVEQRCLVAPVPILFNHDPLFGYTTQRTPQSLFGFDRTVSFDEGDLYGTIGVAYQHAGAVFRLLTHGVWIESTRHSFPSQSGNSISNLGGVVTFDRLHKTADHSAIVEDERYEEMWLRLLPYVNQLVSGRAADATMEVRNLSGDRFENRELLDLMRGSDSIVVVPTEAISRDELYDSALQIGQALDLPIICAPEDSRRALFTLGASYVDFVVPDLEDERELQFYTAEQTALPPRPWLLSPVDLGTSSLLDVIDGTPLPTSVNLPTPTDDVPDTTSDGTPVEVIQKAVWFLDAPPKPDQLPEEWKRQHLDSRGECIGARIYSPVDRASSKRDINVEVRTAGRIVWSGNDDAIAPGQILIIDVTDVTPRLLWSTPEATEKPVAQWIAEAIVESHLSQVEAAADHGLRAAIRADVAPGSNAAQLVLASLAHRVVKRIRSVGEKCRIQFSIVDPKLDAEVLKFPVLKTLSGDDVSLRRIEELMAQCHGLLYALRADIDADLSDLDKSRVIVVDEVMEKLLISLVGPTAYVRVDERDVLATFEEIRCRDVAVGLRDYPDFPFLVEGGDPRNWPEHRQKACVDALGDQLIAIIERKATTLDEQELRRQAWRHLQWFAAHRRPFSFADYMGNQVDQLPLFGLSNRRTCSYSTLSSIIEQKNHVEMLDGWAVGAGELALSDAARREVSVTGLDEPFLLAMNPFVLQLLPDVVQGAAEYHLSQQELDAFDEPDVAADAMLERLIIDDENARGVIGIPNQPVDRPAVVVFGAEERDVVLREDIGQVCGVIGKIRLGSGVRLRQDDVERRLFEAAHDVLSHLLARLPSMSSGDDPDSYERALNVLLDYAGHQLQLVAGMDLTIQLEVSDVLARQILNAPLFPGTDGLPVSAMTLYRDFVDQAETAMGRGVELEFRPRVINTENLLPPLARWIEQSLCVDGIHRPTGRTRPATRPDDHAAGDDAATPSARLEATLEHWINTLHPRTDDESARRFHIPIRVHDDGRFSDIMADEFCQLVFPDNGEQPLVLVNPHHWLTRWIDHEGTHSSRPIAWAILEAYAAINDRLPWVTKAQEMICHRRVADALHKDHLTMITHPEAESVAD